MILGKMKIAATAVALKTNLVYVWDFEEASGDFAATFGSYTWGGNSTAHQMTGKLGYCVETGGSALYNNTAKINNSNSGAVSFWFKTDSLGSKKEILMVAGSSGWIRFYSSSYFGIESQISYTTCRVRGSTALSINTWYHVVIMSNGSAWTMYLNGSAQTLTVEEGSNPGNWFYDVGSGWAQAVGGYTDGFGWSASSIDLWVDQLALWSSTLNAEQITQIYNSGNGYAYNLWT